MPTTVCRNVLRQPLPPLGRISVTKESGFSKAICLTIEGVTQDPDAANSFHTSVANAAVLDLR